MATRNCELANSPRHRGGRLSSSKGPRSSRTGSDRRLILQTELEINGYSRDDPARRSGSGMSDIDAGVRLRYEIRRKCAPDLGLGYQRTFSQTAQYARTDGESVRTLSFLMDIRTWF